MQEVGPVQVAKTNGKKVNQEPSPPPSLFQSSKGLQEGAYMSIFLFNDFFFPFVFELSLMALKSSNL